MKQLIAQCLESSGLPHVSDPGVRFSDTLRTPMAQYLLGYFCSDYSEEDVTALRSLIGRLSAQGPWLHDPPELVDQYEEDSRTRPEDESLRTVGMLLKVDQSGERSPTPVVEPARLVDALARFSLERGVDFELQLDDTYVGSIRRGVADRLVRDGLLSTW